MGVGRPDDPYSYTNIHLHIYGKVYTMHQSTAGGWSTWRCMYSCIARLAVPPHTQHALHIMSCVHDIPRAIRHCPVT